MTSYRNSFRNILVPVLVAVCMAAGILIGQMTVRPSTSPRFHHNKLSQTLELIKNLYVDSVEMDSLIEHVMPLMIGELDPHSVYIPASESLAANETLEGKFDGIGVIFNMVTDTAIVINVISGGPSDKAGVKAGDRILRIDSEDAAGQKIPQNDIVKRLRGPRGSQVVISVERRRGTPPLDIEIVRGEIPIKSLEAAFIMAPEVGFLKLSSFARTSHQEIVEALDRLQSEGMTRLIFDLRGNSGGFLDQAISIANEFLPGRQLIVYTENKRKIRKEEFSNGSGRYATLPLVVLIDEGSASASEILAGAIQDNDRGTVIGRRSFGKGLVQERIDYKDGSQLRLTVSRYYTPTGRSIQKPYDFGATGSDLYRREVRQRYQHNELFTADSIRFNDSLRFVTPGGKTVYGGGGIMPDIFVPLDTVGVTPYYIKVLDRNILYKYTLEYSDLIRDRLNTVHTLPELNVLLDSDRWLVDKFIDYAQRQGVPPVWPEIRLSRKIIETQLRAYIARNSELGDTGFYANIFPVDAAITKALEVIMVNGNSPDEKCQS